MSPPCVGADASVGCCRCFPGKNHTVSDDQSCPHCGKSGPPSSSYCSLLISELRYEKDWEKLRRCVVAATKGFTIGAGLKGGLSAFAILARLSKGRKIGAVPNSEAMLTAVKETLRYGLFLGTFAGTFVSVDEFIASLGGYRRTARWRALLAGLIAGPSMLLTGPNTQHTGLAVYILMRAAVLASRCGIKSKRFGRICKPLTWSHGDIFLMCLSSSQILSAYILKQDSLPPSYRSFLNKHGGKDSAILHGVKELASCIPFTNLDGIENYYKSNGVNINLDPQMKVPCSIVHGNQSCAEHFFSFLVQAYGRALPVYFPVYFVPALIVHRLDLLKSVVQTLYDFGKVSPWYFKIKLVPLRVLFFCMDVDMLAVQDFPEVQHSNRGNGNGIYTLFPTGLALAIEKKSRRIEISLYCLSRAIESFFTCMVEAGFLPQTKRLKRADVVIFSLSTAIIMHCYAQEREVFRSKYLNVLDWVFGIPPVTNEAPQNKNH